MSAFSPAVLFWLELVAKMAMTATVVVIVSIVVERSGPFVGALVAALPSAAGAAYIILALEHPPEFIAASAIGTVAAGAAVSVFALTYAALAQRRGLIVSLGVALLAWFAAAAALRSVNWTPLGAVLLDTVVIGLAMPLSWRYRSSGSPKLFLRRPWDLPLRALNASVVVAAVTTASFSIGSFASGMFAIFPVVFCSSLIILHPRVGGPAAASVMAHAQPFLAGLALGALALHYLVAPIGVWWGFLGALIVNLAWSGSLVLLRTRRAKA